MLPGDKVTHTRFRFWRGTYERMDREGMAVCHTDAVALDDWRDEVRWNPLELEPLDYNG